MNGNAAYDLSRFEEKQKKPSMQVIPPKKPLRKGTVLGMKPAKAITMLLIVGVLASVLIYNRVLIIEANEEIRQANSQMTILESEGTRLDMELEGKTTSTICFSFRRGKSCSLQRHGQTEYFPKNQWVVSEFSGISEINNQ